MKAKSQSEQDIEKEMSMHFMSLSTFLCFFCTISPCIASQSNPIDENKHSAYDVLEDYNLPVGLLPQGIIGYNLEVSTGKFTVYLHNSCSFSLERSYRVHYKSVISGHISRGKLVSLDGVSVKVLVFWFDVLEVKRKGEYLEFSVEIGGATFPVDYFYECPQCGCGLNCNNGQVNRLVQTTSQLVCSY